MKPRCAVFLSAYNGEKYLPQQIDSILNQHGLEIKLMIRDDGSTDNTQKVLAIYKNDPRVSVLAGSNIGFGQSFLSLMFSVSDSYDCYAFSDQDDIWDEDKLVSGWDSLKSINEAALYYCGQRIVNEKGEKIGEDSSLGRITKCTKYSASKSNLIRGCTMVWNKKMQIELLKHKPDIIRIKEHDIWVSWVALFVGIVIFDHNPHMSYRQVGSSVSPGAKRNGLFSIIHKYEVMKYVWKKWAGLKFDYAEELEKVFPDCKLATCHYKDDLNCLLELIFSKKYNAGVPLKWRLMSDLMIITGHF